MCSPGNFFKKNESPFCSPCDLNLQRLDDAMWSPGNFVPNTPFCSPCGDDQNLQTPLQTQSPPRNPNSTPYCKTCSLEKDNDYSQNPGNVRVHKANVTLRFVDLPKLPDALDQGSDAGKEVCSGNTLKQWRFNPEKCGRVQKKAQSICTSTG